MEKELQIQCENYLKLKKIKYIHLENQSRSKNRYTGTRKYKGMPDLIVFQSGGTKFFELKTDAGKLSHEQIDTMHELSQAGYMCAVIRDFETFEKLMEL